MHCYRVYTPLWLWYWPWVHNVLQRLAWGKKKIPLHSKVVGRQGRRLSEQKPQRVQPETQGARTGSHAVGDWSEDLWKAWRAQLRNVSRRTRARCGIARAEAWLGTWRHMDSRTLTVVQVWGSPRRRNVRDGGCEDDGVGLPRRALQAVAVPGEFCVIKKRLRAKFKIVLCYPTADSWNPWQWQLH